MIDTLDIEITDGATYRLTGTFDVQWPSVFAPPALLICKFRDADGAPLTARPAGFQYSFFRGAFIRLGEPSATGTVNIDQSFVAPPRAAFATLILRGWRARKITAIKPLSIVRNYAFDDTAQEDERLIWRTTMSCNPKEVLEVSGEFSRPLAPREVVAAIRFLDTNGANLDPDGPLNTSQEVGPYQYLTPADTKTGYARFHAPPEAAEAQIRLYNWVLDPKLTLHVAQTAPRHLREDCLAFGKLDVDGDSPCQFTTSFDFTGPHPILFALTFFDRTGRIIDSETQNLKRNTRYEGFVEHIPDTLQRHDGQGEVRLELTPPEAAKTLHWSIFLPRGGQHSLRGAPDLAPATPQRDIPWFQSDNTLRDRLSQDPPESTSNHRILARLAAATPQEGWLKLSGSLTRDAGGLDKANILLRTWFFSDTGKLMTSVPSPGFGESEEFGQHRLLCPTTDDERGTAARFEAPVFCPPEASIALFDVITKHSGDSIQITQLATSPVKAKDVCGTLPLPQMTRPQLIQALEIANHAKDLHAAHAILSALSAVDPETKGFVYRARALRDQLDSLDTTWLPNLPRARQYSPQENHVLIASHDPAAAHALADALQHKGLVPALALSSTAPDSGLPKQFPISRNALPGPTNNGMAPTDTAELEARQFGTALARHNAQLLHFQIDPAHPFLTLGAVALAQTYGTALVLEFGAVTQDTLTAPQLTRCLHAADAVLAAPDIEVPADIDATKVFPMPYAVEHAFDTPALEADVNRLHSTLSTSDARILGLFCDGNPPDQDTLHLLAHADPDLVVLVIGAHEAPSAGPQQVLTPDNNLQTDPSVWLRICHAAMPDPRSGLQFQQKVALRAMAQGVPMICPDNRVNRALAGPNLDRLTLFDPADLSSALKQMVNAPNTLLAQTQRANVWIEDACGWAQKAALCQKAYARALARLGVK